MKVTLASVAALAAVTSASPIQKRQAALTDADILQFALTLEHLENRFYVDALNMMPESDFLDAGYSKAYYDNLKFIAHDEQEHVGLLTQGLTTAGATPVKPCTYKFPYTDAKSFVSLSSVLEGVGSSAYLGAAPAIKDKEYLTIAGSILATEAIHTSLQRYTVGHIAAANPYETPLGPNEVYTLAAAFIVECPPDNAPLPFKAFPTLTATQGIPAAPGIDFTFSTEADMPESFFITFVSGLDVVSQPASVKDGLISATIPEVTQGQTYAVATNANTTMITDAQVIAGPAILEVTPPSPTFGEYI